MTIYTELSAAIARIAEWATARSASRRMSRALRAWITVQ